MRKHIKPAHPDATIPDPARRCDLPPEGLPCEWSVHWARLAARGDVIVTDIKDEAKPAVSAPRPARKRPAKARKPKVARTPTAPAAPAEPVKAPDPPPADPGLSGAATALTGSAADLGAASDRLAAPPAPEPAPAEPVPVT